LRGDCHFSRPAVAHRLKRPTLRRRTSSPFTPEGALSLYLDLQPIRFAPAECRHPPRELLPHVFTLTLDPSTSSGLRAVYFSVALSVALADTFLLRSMVLCAVPTFLAPAFPTRDSLPESRCKITKKHDRTVVFRQNQAKSRHQRSPFRGRPSPCPPPSAR